MSKTFIIALALFTASAVSILPAQSNTKAGASAPVDALPSSQVSPLTRKECTNLGSSVKNDSVCKSGKTCKMNSANGDQHFVCLESAQ